MLLVVCALVVSISQAHSSAPPAVSASVAGAVNHLDQAFGEHGVASIITSYGNPNYYKSAGFAALALQPDGMIVVAGELEDNVMVARYTSAGALDTSFGGTGIITTTLLSLKPGFATAVALQPDHKIVVGGSASGEFVLLRYTANGSLDPSFGGTGIVTTTIALQSYDAITALALQPDGKIVVAGATGSSYYLLDSAVVLARYTATGALDPSFAGGITPTSLRYDYGTGLALQPDGKIVAAGVANDGNALASYFALTRYTSNGTLDASFGDAGIVSLYNKQSRVYALAIQSDGKIVAAGPSSTLCYTRCDQYFTLARYLPSGKPDRSFGGSGVITSDVDGRITALGLQPDGKLLAAGTYTSPPLLAQPPVALLARFIDNAGAIYVPLIHR
jgi:uncharacterized delta-60 repeat protein